MRSKQHEVRATGSVKREPTIKNLGGFDAGHAGLSIVFNWEPLVFYRMLLICSHCETFLFLVDGTANDFVTSCEWHRRQSCSMLKIARLLSPVFLSHKNGFFTRRWQPYNPFRIISQFEGRENVFTCKVNYLVTLINYVSICSVMNKKQHCMCHRDTSNCISDDGD